MKSLVLIIMLFSFTTTFAQADTTNFTIPLTKVVELDSTHTSAKMTADYLNWVAINFKSANDVIQQKDIENSTVVIKFVLNSKPITAGVYAEGSTHCTLTFKAKDGKYKLEFSQIYFKYYQFGTVITYEDYRNTYLTGKIGKKSALNYVIDVNKEIQNMVNSIEMKLNSKVEIDDGF